MSEELTMEAIEASLGELVKAADATDLLKAYGGVAVDTYGHTDERGKVAGTLADSGDMGSLDSMMIGKMAQTLQDAGYPADAVSAFMSAFQEGDDEDEDEDEDDAGYMSGKFGAAASTSGGVGTNPRARASGGKGMGKSMDHFREDPDMADSLDVSPFLEALTARTAEQLDRINKSLYGHAAQQGNVNRAQAVATYNLGQLVKSIAQVTDALAYRLGLVESQPQAPKGQTRLTGAQPLHKGMPNEAGGLPPQAGASLQKSHVLSVLSFMNLEKGIREIAGRPTSELIGTYEAGGQLSQQTFDAVQGFLAAHPHEAETAVSYR